jgi:hypothetical protein
VKEGRPSVDYGSLHMHELSSGISIWLAERMRLLTGRERERDAQTDFSLKASFSTVSLCLAVGIKWPLDFLYLLLTPVINKSANWKT